MLRNVLVVVTFVFAARTTVAQYCELEIAIVDQQLRPIAAAVVLRGGMGIVTAHSESRDGVVRICDVGFQPFALEITEGADCASVRIEGLKHRWARPVKLKVMVPDCLDVPILSPSGCTALLRVRDRNGSIPAEVSFEGVPDGPARVGGDKYGRIAFPMSYGTQAKILIRVKGSPDVSTVVDCGRAHPHIERTILVEASGEVH